MKGEDVERSIELVPLPLYSSNGLTLVDRSGPLPDQAS